MSAARRHNPVEEQPSSKRGDRSSPRRPDSHESIEPAAVQTRARLLVTGMVQGVGFRPFIYRLAGRFRLNGWVLNSTEGVVIEVEGTVDALERFTAAISQEAPPRATVECVQSVLLPLVGYPSFMIETSHEDNGHFALVSPDIAVCADCLRELRDPADRRYRYPFINCTNCGPRFTVIADVPYDRPNTTMACFSMCPECRREYDDPTSRRFHAQPNACPACGPHVWLTSGAEPERLASGEGAICRVRDLLQSGAIVAIKGLGGFHLACDARNDDAVTKLRRRKRRTDKPFAVMLPDAEAVEMHCHLSEGERSLLQSPQRPIVLLRRRRSSDISRLVAPGNRDLGVMLPYTPLHHLLLEQAHSADPSHPPALVMTSGNLSEEPIAAGNREALERLHTLADAFLLHDRDIAIRCDDPVTRISRDREMVVRRARGYAPFPVRLGFELREVLACGAQLKSSFCITRGSYAFLSQHIGDLENAETLRSYSDSIDHFKRLFRLDIGGVAHDMHPDYLATLYARDLARERSELPLLPVQHHHAHIASCMAENGVDEPVLGVAFDGTGYGADGDLWGGEFLLCEYSGYRRLGHLRYVALPGGEAAVRHPRRMAAAYLLDSLGAGALEEPLLPLLEMNPLERAVLRKQIERGINSPLTSSVGRLFDAVSSLLGLRHEVSYEGQAAIELEMMADEGEMAVYPWDLISGDPCAIDMRPAIRQIVAEHRDGVPAATISARFHNTVADMIAGTCLLLREESGINLVALSGGVFQNLMLLERARWRLEALGFTVLTHHRIPANDGGIALGQAVIASRLLGES
jgi:hydrogenase maturation protein HypF